MYTFEISLTIVGVKPSDLANYTCEARNSYGTVRGTIQLESMYHRLRLSKDCQAIYGIRPTQLLNCQWNSSGIDDYQVLKHQSSEPKTYIFS